MSINKKIKNNKIINFNKYFLKTKKKIKQIIKKYFNKINKTPIINIIKIGNLISSNIYIKNKCKIFKYVGIKYKIYEFNKNIKEKIIIKKIKKINKNKKIDCILIQLPIPKNINEKNIINKISPIKDVDGLNNYNIGKLLQGKSFIKPCTIRGIIKILKKKKTKIKGSNILIINTSNLIGKPLSMELVNKGATVTLANTKTKNIQKHINNSDILISATGKYNYFPSKWIKKKCVIIDVGIIRHKNNKITGDINYKKIIKKIKYITAVPGGVGLMTMSMLLKNIIKIYKKRNNINS